MKTTFRKAGLAAAIASVTVGQAFAETQASDDQLEIIVVTGQKMERSLQDTKESVAVFTKEVLEQRNLTDFADVFQQTAGVSGDQFGFRIRGIRSTDGASAPNRGDLASVVLDGVTTTGWVKSETVGQLWDVSQVEVLRGPQSTNLGRSALAGAVVMNTNDPEYDNGGKLRTGFGKYGNREYKGVANINLVDGVAALRFSAEKTQSDGYIDNITRGEDDAGARVNEVYRMKLLLEPSEELRMVVSLSRLKNEYGESISRLAPFDRDDRISLDDTDNTFKTEADLGSLKLNYNLSDNWDLISVSSYQDGERFRLSDGDRTPASFGNGGGTVIRNSEDTSWSQEFRFNYSADAVRSSTGIYYSKTEAKRSSDTALDYDLVSLFNDFQPGAGLLLTNPLPVSPTFILPALYPEFFDTQNQGFTDVDNTNWAVFSEWELDLGNSWTVSFGVRYDEENQKFSTANSGTSTATLPVALGAPIGLIPIAPGFTFDDVINLANSQLVALTSNVPVSDSSKDFDNILPHAGITYHWDENISSSFFVKKSYRSGGTELTLLNGINDFDEEELWNYELALRAVVLQGKGVFNANVYYGDWTDQQVSIQEPGTSNAAFRIIVNAGSSEIYGTEISFDYSYNEQLSFYFNAAISKTKYKEFLSDGNDFKSNRFRFAPEHTGTVGARYANSQGLFINVSGNYTGSSYSDVSNETKLDGHTLVNINAGYEMGDLVFETYAKNLFDKTYATNNSIRATDGSPAALLGDPRTYGVRATYSF